MIEQLEVLQQIQQGITEEIVVLQQIQQGMESLLFICGVFIGLLLSILFSLAWGRNTYV